jgi:hypothetical protein
MQVKNLLDLVKVIQAGVEEFYGLHAVAESGHIGYGRLTGPSPLEKELGMDLFGVALKLYSPTQQLLMTRSVGWEFKTGEGVRLAGELRGGKGIGLSEDDEYEAARLGKRGELKRLTPETEIKSVKVHLDREASDDLLCHLRLHVKKTCPKVEVLLQRR